VRRVHPAIQWAKLEALTAGAHLAIASDGRTERRSSQRRNNGGNTKMTELTVPRRMFVAGSGLSLLGVLAATRDAAAQPRSGVETRNIGLVNEFCAAWSTRDLQRVTALMADNSVYRMTETTPPLTGHAALIAQMQPWVDTSSSIEFKILETFAAGPMVMNHRIDRFASTTRPLTWEGVGIFFVKDGKIQEWSDYTIGVKRE
jgi:limonene-1,2-epoxide hydrolase